MPKLNDSIEALLSKLDAAETDEEIRAVGRALLEEDPKSPYGKLALWETLEYEKAVSNLDMLKDALDEIRAVIESREEPAFIDGDRDSQVYCQILMNLGYSLFSTGAREEALVIAKELANFDDEGYFPSRELLYRCMLDLELYTEILETLEIDPLESVVGEHSRAIALISTNADRTEIRDAINYAISLAPDVPFFILDIWDFPGEEDDVDDELEEVILDATYLADPWSSTDQRLLQLSLPVFMLGYLTERIEDEKEIETLRQTYECAGILDEVDKSKAKIAGMMMKDADPEEIDAVAMGEVEELIDKMTDEGENLPF